MKEHRIALVTGASRGIGAETARQLLTRGFTAPSPRETAPAARGR